MSLLYNLIELAAGILTFFYCMHASAIFLRKSVRFTWWKLLLSCIPYTALTWQPIPFLSNEAVSILALLFCLGTIMILFQGEWWRRLLVVIAFNAFDLLLTSLLLSFFHLLKNSSMEVLITPGSLERVLFLIFLYLVEFFILYFASHLKLHLLTGNVQGLNIATLFFFCDFSVTFLVYYILLYYAKNNPSLTALCVFLDLFVIILSFAGLYMLKNIYSHHMTELENQMLQQQLRDQIILLQESEEKYELVRAVKHDIKKYLINYRFLLQEGNVKEVLNNISALLDGPLDSTLLTYTDNPMLNAFLHRMADSCKAHDIALQINVHLNPMYRNIELMVVLSNLFENAITAETRYSVSERLIRFELIQEDDKISLIIQNYIPESILENNPDLKSTKSNPYEHGFGIKNVRNIIHVQHGLIDIYEDHNMFHVHILLPNR